MRKCACGCGRELTGRTQVERFALPACRARAYRRRQLGLPEDQRASGRRYSLRRLREPS